MFECDLGGARCAELRDGPTYPQPSIDPTRQSPYGQGAVILALIVSMILFHQHQW